MRYSTLLTLTSFIGLTSLVLLPTISAQTLAPIRRLPLNEPLETSKNMPPAPPRKIETSPRKVSQFGVFTSYQANVDATGNNILGDAANEPSIAVDPTDGNKMIIGWRQFDSIQLRLPARRLGLYDRCRRALDVPRCSGTRSFSQRSCNTL